MYYSMLARTKSEDIFGRDLWHDVRSLTNLSTSVLHIAQSQGSKLTGAAWCHDGLSADFKGQPRVEERSGLEAPI